MASQPMLPFSAERIPAAAQPLLLTVRQAAAMLGLGRSTVYELIAAGELEVVHIGRSARLPVATLEEYVERLRGGVSS